MFDLKVFIIKKNNVYITFVYFNNSLLGNGFITIEVLREILRELDEKLTEDDLDNMVDEIDTDGSGTVDWEGKTLLSLLSLS